ncbi:TetR/AcrR family transcriptional regulator [Actinophytocola algeriensis]|uniref:DNA-binding transcriptional regulator YbjK n=1 Tax=Actinophytocola algeriensis TaxID=1768010 RepID=A0A7W7QDI4_9PSEU|nr:TetR family transcriptional regulator [Actinophytocola algeriensis]MBB4911590.1 DNA-binding transcriptional regulator YbjK [Actinophytocola algeriensis]MBE1473422.1 DNA-binding transcriptional regulator YbjK [Actinophytocola algeriensis]
MSGDEGATVVRRRGPTDRDRRDRIARAAVTVVGERGIDGLTHRKVAAAAGVPLGSTTYHFATLDDLIAAALDKAAERSVTELRAWEQSLEPDADLAAALADFVLRSVTEKRADTMAEYNLYALALHRPHLRQAAVAWDDALAAVLRARTDPLTGQMLGALLCGLLMQSVLRDDQLDRADLAAQLRRALVAP